jgi:hypothetical protein
LVALAAFAEIIIANGICGREGAGPDRQILGLWKPNDDTCEYSSMMVCLITQCCQFVEQGNVKNELNEAVVLYVYLITVVLQSETFNSIMS